MTNDQTNSLKEISDLEGKLKNAISSYWHNFSYLNTWQFWIDIALLVVPLIILFFTIDRKRIFLIGFYGFNIHVWFSYIEIFSIRTDLVSYPYFVFPYFQSFPLDASLVPVLFMLVYQWTLNHKKNFYLYSLVSAACLAFVFKPIMVGLELIQLGEKMNFFKMFLVYIGLFLASKAITSLFIYMQRKTKEVK